MASNDIAPDIQKIVLLSASTTGAEASPTVSRRHWLQHVIQVICDPDVPIVIECSLEKVPTNWETVATMTGAGILHLNAYFPILRARRTDDAGDGAPLVTVILESGQYIG